MLAALLLDVRLWAAAPVAVQQNLFALCLKLAQARAQFVSIIQFELHSPVRCIWSLAKARSLLIMSILQHGLHVRLERFHASTLGNVGTFALRRRQ